MDLEKLYYFLKKAWYEKAGLITALIVTTLTESTLLVAASAPWQVLIGILALNSLFVGFSWLLTTKPPVVQKGKVGFLVCITTNNDKEGVKLREDFVIPLRDLIKSGSPGSTFHYIERAGPEVS